MSLLLDTHVALWAITGDARGRWRPAVIKAPFKALEQRERSFDHGES